MTGWLRCPPELRRLLPEQKRRTAPWIVGLMTFVSLIVGAAGLSVLGAARDLERDAEGRWSLQVSGTANDATRALALLRRTPEVADVAPVPETEVRKTLGQWLGPSAETLDLPLPTLADVSLRAGADGSSVVRRLANEVPEARLLPYTTELAPLLDSLRWLSVLVIGLLVTLAAALAAAVTLAARASLDANRSTLDIFHNVGATDEQLLAMLQRRIAIDALAGGAIGGAAAAIVLAVALIPARSLLGGFGGSGLLGPGSILLLVLLPFLQAVLATLVARWALRKALAELP